MKKVVSIKKIKPDIVYDLKVKRNKNFLANNTVVHNCDYRGEISAMYFYPKTEKAKILAGNKVVQGLLIPVSQTEFKVVKKLPDTIRGEGGFGSTGE